MREIEQISISAQLIVNDWSRWLGTGTRRERWFASILSRLCSQEGAVLQ
jgi:hypothetical protein